MQVVYPVCGGIGGHPAALTACLHQVTLDGQIIPELRLEVERSYPHTISIPSYARWIR